MGEIDWGGNCLALVSKATLSKSLIQFSIDGLGCVPSLLFDLRPNNDGGKDDNGDLLQKVPCMHCCSRSVPLTLKQTTTNPCLCWRLLDSHGQVWVSLFLLQGIFPTQGSNPDLLVSCIGRRILYHWATWEVQLEMNLLNSQADSFFSLLTLT